MWCTSSAASSGATPSPKVTVAPRPTENGAAPRLPEQTAPPQWVLQPGSPFADKRIVSLPLNLKTSKGVPMGHVSEHGIFIYLKINWLKN